MNKLSDLLTRMKTTKNVHESCRCYAELSDTLVNAAPEIADLMETYKEQGHGWLDDLIRRLEALDKKLNGEVKDEQG